MEKEDTNSFGGIVLGGNNVTLPETGKDSGGAGDGAGTESTKNSARSKPKSEGIKEISKRAYISVIKRPFTIIARLRKRDYWKLDKEDEADVAESYECVAKVIPGFFVKYFCFVNFGVSMFAIVAKRLMEDKRIRDEAEKDEEGKEETVGKKMDQKPEKKGEKGIGRGVRNG